LNDRPEFFQFGHRKPPVDEFAPPRFSCALRLSSAEAQLFSAPSAWQGRIDENEFAPSIYFQFGALRLRDLSEKSTGTQRHKDTKKFDLPFAFLVSSCLCVSVLNQNGSDRTRRAIRFKPEDFVFRLALG
jgi:hypothetical protein